MSARGQRPGRDGHAYGADGLGPFPRVDRKYVAAERDHASVWSRWSAAPMRGLRISAHMAGPFVPALDDALHLDGILSSAALAAAPPAVGTLDGVVIPVPLQAAWIDERGYPLWACTDLLPHGPSADGVDYIHSRYPADVALLATRQRVLTSAGQYKDVRLPLRTRDADTLVAWAIGLRTPLQHLLAGVDHVGKKAAHGFGRVLSWTVEECAVDLDWILERRPVPLKALGDAPVAATRIAPRLGWTPPYWDSLRHLPCRRAQWTI